MRKGYRLRMSALARWGRVGLFVLCGLILLSGVFVSTEAWIWRAVSAVGVVFAVLSVRVVLGAAVVITPQALVIQRLWPLRRRVKWYRIDHAEVMPGYWTILVELIDGERFELPCVEDIDDLYHDLEHHRKALDSAS